MFFRLFGLLTQRAAITLVFYLHETNQVLCKWFSNFVAANPVPRSGSNDESSGDELLRKLLCLGEQRIDNPCVHGHRSNCLKAHPMSSPFLLRYTFESFSFDPGSLVSRLLEVRAELAREWAEDLRWVKAENADLLRSNLQCSLQLRVTEGTDDDGRPL